jgi:hypothetical protein
MLVSGEGPMGVSVYIAPASMAPDQYDEIIARLRAVDAVEPRGRRYHVAFYEPGGLHVFEIWDSKEDFEAFAPILLQTMAEVGVDPGTPTIKPMHNVDARAAVAAGD